MDKISIPSATIYGSGSGGILALALLQEHEKITKRIIVHEIPMECLDNLKVWAQQPESENDKIAGICKGIFANSMNKDKQV
jgi:hypothetical protein